MNITQAPDTVRAFGQALGTRDHPRIAALLAPEASFDAILPGRHLAVGDRTSLTWRGVLRTADRAIGDRLIEQHMVLDVGDGGIDRIELLCTGFRRLPPTPEARVHDFDAGELSCTDGFTTEFQRRLRVTTRDPSAPADLPAMTRLMGHQLVAVRDLHDGRTEFTVARTH